MSAQCRCDIRIPRRVEVILNAIHQLRRYALENPSVGGEWFAQTHPCASGRWRSSLRIDVLFNLRIAYLWRQYSLAHSDDRFIW
jgi:hypothetical protein